MSDYSIEEKSLNPYLIPDLIGIVNQYIFEKVVDVCHGIITTYTTVFDKKHGKSTSYHNGRLVELCYYVNGELDGKFMRSHLDDFCSYLRCTYTNGKLNGKYSGVDPEDTDYGKLVGYYINDKLNGYAERTDRSGTVESGNYLNNKRHGVHNTCAVDGSVVISNTYVNGKMLGESKAYYSTGELNCNCRMESVNGLAKKHGVLTQWYKSGKVKLQISYYHGVKHGRELCYYSNGVLKHIGKWHMGKIHGVCKYYKRSGKFIGETIVQHGERIN